ncbi:hypothetical protein KP509_07G062100 [Ceratopteris richardii]|uniref:Pentatricopeptide repeat-containing protein n=1 Tax=Ceratopteris richardii TaxID=49495 RepID=A0A8T2UIC6_CERRI|nr:hypothetical protein KP509_07G062100 [Ceratopteris richardii]KAH7433266.1 hypothetical protein KP509_07G062100 [Ceratopteris richardii]
MECLEIILFVCLLSQALFKACAKLREQIPGQSFHSDVVKLGYETHPFLGSSLVDMYTKCGSFFSACNVFERLQNRDVVLWTTIISGLIDQGLVDEALKSVEMMQQEGISPNAVTFSCVLRGCENIVSLKVAYHIHMRVSVCGFEKELCVKSTLMDAYAKCGSFMEAENLFKGVTSRDVVLWTALISAYANHGFGDSALDCLDSMQKDGVSPNEITYMCTLKAFKDIDGRDKVYQIHSEFIIRGFESSPSVGSSLVYTYGRCSMLQDALAVLNGLGIQDSFSCNSLLLAYTEQGLDDAALDSVEKMQVEGVSFNAFTFVCTLKACGRQKLIEKGFSFHDEIIREEFELDPYVTCALVDMYSKCGFFSEAWALVEEASVPNVAVWTALISGLLESYRFKEALHCLRRMQIDGLSLDSVTYICGLKACGGARALEEGQKLHAEVVQDGHEREPSVGNTLVDMYAKCGLLAEAQYVFIGLPVRQLVSWTALLTGYMEFKLFEEALEIYRKLMEERFTVDSIIFMSGLKACSNLGAIGIGQMIHTDISREGYEEDPAIMSTLVDMYAKCGSMVEAFEMFDEISAPNIVLWTTLLTGFACQGDSKAVFYLFDRLNNASVQTDAVTILNIVTVCSHIGLVEMGLRVFQEINSQDMSIELYNCFLDIVSRAGQLNSAIFIAEGMPFQPNIVTWNTILGACQKWKSVKLGELAFQCALSLEYKQPAPYASMISIYADAHMWEDMKRVDNLRELTCVNNSALSLSQLGMLHVS